MQARENQITEIKIKFIIEERYRQTWDFRVCEWSTSSPRRFKLILQDVETYIQVNNLKLDIKQDFDSGRIVKDTDSQKMSSMEKKQGREIVKKKSSSRKIIHHCFDDGVFFWSCVEKNP